MKHNGTRGAQDVLEKSESATNSKGFTLVELAVVVMIIALVMTMGLAAFNAQLTSASYAETKRRQVLVKEALIAYLGANKRLPCPDVPNNTNAVADTSQINGNEDRLNATVILGCVDIDGDGIALGVLPYSTLGLGREVAMDGWGNFMTYRISAGTPSPICPSNAVDWSRSACFGVGKVGQLSVSEGFVGAPTAVSANVIAAVISHGANGLGAWATLGTRNAVPVTCEEAHNSLTALPGCVIFPGRLYKGERPENDDVVSYINLDEHGIALNRLAAVKSAQGQVVDDLAMLMDDALGMVLLNGCNYADSGGPPGTPRIPNPVARDPWGNLYFRADNITYRGVENTGISLVVGSTVPICFYTLGPNAAGLVDTALCTASNNAVAKSITKASLEGYLAKAGHPNC